MSLREYYEKYGVEITEEQEEKLLEFDRQFSAIGNRGFLDAILFGFLIKKNDIDIAKVMK